MGNLFFRGVGPVDIKDMTFYEMKYWNEWHKIMEKAETTEANRIRALTGKK